MGGPEINEPLRDWNSFDVMGPNGSPRIRRNTGDFGVRLKKTKMIKKSLKSTFITEIGRIKVSEKGNPRPLPLVFSHIPSVFVL
jgi:hypothetical protein